MGPTGSGKTALACELVEHFPMQIISVDSAMIYRDMNIGTAKPDAQTLARAPHLLIDMLDPTESYSVARFCDDVRNLCKQSFAQGKIPLLVGGSMMYFRALQQGLSYLPAADPLIRSQLLQEAKAMGWAHMHAQLARVDAVTAARIHPNDTQRIQRALEVYQLTQKPLSFFLDKEKDLSTHNFINLVLLPEERSWLHQRIALRFEQMLAEGLIEEVKNLIKTWHLTLEHPSMRSVGYRQVMLYLQGGENYATLCDKGIAATRQLAKRQITWLRNWPDSHIFYAENPLITQEIHTFMRNFEE